MSHPLPSRSTRPVVPNIQGLAHATYQHEFKPVTPRIVGTPGTGASHPVVAKPMAAYRPGAVASSPPPAASSDPFERRGMISSTLAEARAFVQQMDARGGASMAARPASLVEPSRPYTPRLARRSSPFNPGMTSSSSISASPSASASSLHSYANFGDPFPGPPPGTAGVFDADDDEVSATAAAVFGGKKVLRKRSSASASGIGGTGSDDVADIDLIRSDSALSFNGGASRPGSSSMSVRSRSASTASPMSQFGSRRSPLPASHGVNVPELAFPAAGTDEDWRMVEATVGDETSRPGTAAPRPISRQNSATRAHAAAAAVNHESHATITSPPPQPRPPSGSPGGGARPRSRPNSSTSDHATAATSGRPSSASRSGPSLQLQQQFVDAKVAMPNPVASSPPPAATSTPVTARPSSALFARPLEVSNALIVDAKDLPSTAAAPADTTEAALDLLSLQRLHAAYLAASVVEKPDALRGVLTAAYRTLQSSTKTPADALAPLLRFAWSLPGGDAAARVHTLAARLVFEASRDARNDRALADMLPDITSGVLARPARGMRAVSCVVGAVHNLSVEGGASSGGAGAAALLSQPLVDALGLLLRSEAHRTLKIESEEDTVRFLLEVTGVLRNIACVPGAHRLFVAPIVADAADDQTNGAAKRATTPPPTQSCLDLLCQLTVRLSHHASLLLNLARILSKLSLHQTCRAVMYAPLCVPVGAPLGTLAQPSDAFLPALVSSLHVHHVKLSLCVRVLYILGNLTMQNDVARRAIAECTCNTSSEDDASAPTKPKDDEEASKEAPTTPTVASSMTGAEVLLSLLARSYQRDSKLRKLLSGSVAPTGTAAAAAAASKKHQTMLRENEDLLVKLLRLLANLAISSAVGPTLLADRRCGALIKLLKHKAVDSAEELVLNAVSAVTNLSFYLKHDGSRPTSGAGPTTATAPTKEPLVFFHPPRDVLGVLLSYLFSSNVELLSEVCRALGNFSRDLAFRLLMRAARVDEAIILLLDHNDAPVVYGAAGVALNMAAHTQGQESLLEDDALALAKMVDVIDRFGLPASGAPETADGEEETDDNPQPEWPLVIMILKTFLNLRCAPPRSPSVPSSMVMPDMVLKREVPADLRLHLLSTLEEVLDRTEAESEALRSHADEEDPSIAAELQTIAEVDALAQQLMPACVVPPQWQ